ncbi:unnamed protein product, partial [Hymenolepis diminuta]
IDNCHQCHSDQFETDLNISVHLNEVHEHYPSCNSLLIIAFLHFCLEMQSHHCGNYWPDSQPIIFN